MGVIQHFWRTLSRNRASSVIAIAMLALGLAAVGVMFAVISTVLMRALPFRDSNRIVRIANYVPIFGSGPAVCTLAEFEGWQKSGLFEAAAAIDTADFTLEGYGRAEQIYGARVTPDFFRVFGVAPVLGRGFAPSDGIPGHGDVIILSHELWARRFASDRSILGKSIRLSGELMTIIGVMPAGFAFPRLADVSTIMSWAPERSEFWVPLVVTQDAIQSGNFNYYILGRLRSGVTNERAAAQFRAAAVELFREAEIREPAYRTAIEQMLPLFRVEVMPLAESMVSGIRDVLWMLLAAVGLLLALVLFNVGNVLLTRNANRLGEYTIRQALGASRWQLFRESFLEQIVVVAVAAGLSAFLIRWAIDVVRASAANRLPRLYELTFDWQDMAVLTGLALATTIVFGALPQLILPGSRIGSFLHGQSRTATGDRRTGRLKSALMIAEIAVSIMLLVGAGLLLQSFVNVMHVSPGFDPNQVLTVTVPFDVKKYVAPAEQVAHTRGLLEMLQKIPGVESVAVVNRLPLTGEKELHSIRALGGPVSKLPDVNVAEYRVISAEYFHVMRIPLLEGRLLRPDDPAKFTVINHRMAQLLWPGEDPIGKQIVESDNQPHTIIGVVGDVHGGTLEAEPRMQFYRLITANPGWASTFVMRCSVDPMSVVPPVQNAVSSLDASEPVTHAQTMQHIFESVTLARRFETVLVGGFAVSALFLSAIGLFGIASLAVTRRIRELGIRLALGASAARILRLELVRALMIALAGLAAGLIASLIVARSLTALLFRVSAWNAEIYGLAAGILSASALLAAWFPARRAARIDPATALRQE